MEAKLVQVQRLQERTASTQVQHNKVETMGGDFYAVLGQVRELRHRHEEQCEGNEVQLVHSDEACARVQSCEAAIENSCYMALYRL